MNTVTLHEGDNRVSLRRLIDSGVRVHSVCTDPPYGYDSIVKRFGKDGAAPAKPGKDGAFKRVSTPFMGKSWDATGIERDPEFWALIYEILLPGGFVFAFSSPRTGHRQATAMEDAGFIMHPLHIWANGQGMPKAHDAAKAIDKHFKKVGEVVPNGAPVKRMIPGADQHKDGTWIKDNGREYQPGEYIPATPEAAQWNGWKYGTQSQKPVLEPIYLGQKPFSEKTGAANLLKHGVGAFNIDDCRIPTEEGGRPLREVAALRGDVEYKPNSLSGRMDGSLQSSKAIGSTDKGRFPSNLILDGSPEVVAMFPDSKGQQGRSTDANRSQVNTYGSVTDNGKTYEPRNDSGSAARFFHHFPPDMNPIVYNSKASSGDRGGSTHATVKPIALMQYLIRHITPPGGTVLDPFAGSGTTAEAARREGFDCILMEAEPEYIEFLNSRFDLGDDDDLLGGTATDDFAVCSTKSTLDPDMEDML